MAASLNKTPASTTVQLGVDRARINCRQPVSRQKISYRLSQEFCASSIRNTFNSQSSIPMPPHCYPWTVEHGSQAGVLIMNTDSVTKSTQVRSSQITRLARYILLHVHRAGGSSFCVLEPVQVLHLFETTFNEDVGLPTGMQQLTKGNTPKNITRSFGTLVRKSFLLTPSRKRKH